MPLQSAQTPLGLMGEKTSISQLFLLRMVHSQLLFSQVKADVCCSRQGSCSSDSDGVFSKILTPFLLQQLSPNCLFPELPPGRLTWKGFANRGHRTFCMDIGERIGRVLPGSRAPVHHVDPSLLLFHLLPSFQGLNEVFILIGSYHSSLRSKTESTTTGHVRARRPGLTLDKLL